MSTAPKSTSTSYTGTKVLVVDDDRFQLDLTTEMLHSLGKQDVTCVTSGAEALQKISSRPDTFQLIMIDLHMPGMDGFQFMDSLAQVGYKGALVIISGQSDDVMRGATLVAKLRRFTLLGALPKPVDRAALATLIARV